MTPSVQERCQGEESAGSLAPLADTWHPWSRYWLLELQTKVRNHGEGPYYGLLPRREIGTLTQLLS